MVITPITNEVQVTLSSPVTNEVEVIWYSHGHMVFTRLTNDDQITWPSLWGMYLLTVISEADVFPL